MKSRRSSLRIGTWNLEYASGAEKNAMRLELITRMDCDLWVLTETHDDIDLAATHEGLRSLQREGRRLGERWVVIWSKFPVVQRLEVVDANRSTAALIETPLGRLVLFGTVFPWHADRGPKASGAPPRNWTEQYRVIAEQAGEWRSLQDANPDAHLIVAGDLNMDLGGRHYYGTAVGRELLRDAMQECGIYCATETPRIPEGSLCYPPIDHILISSCFAGSTKVVSAWEGETENVRLSDHSGLAVEVGCHPR